MLDRISEVSNEIVSYRFKILVSQIVFVILAASTLQDYLQDGYTNALGFPRPLPVLPVRSGYVYLQHQLRPTSPVARRQSCRHPAQPNSVCEPSVFHIWPSYLEQSASRVTINRQLRHFPATSEDTSFYLCFLT